MIEPRACGRINCDKRGKSCSGWQAREIMERLASAGKQVAAGKRGKSCSVFPHLGTHPRTKKKSALKVAFAHCAHYNNFSCCRKQKRRLLSARRTFVARRGGQARQTIGVS